MFLLKQALRQFCFVRAPCHTRIVRRLARTACTAILGMAGSRGSRCDQKIARLCADRQNAINELLASTYKLDRKESEMVFWIFAALLSLNVALAEELQTQSPSDGVALAKNLEALAERLKDQPDNDKGWYMLGRSYLNIGNYEQSAAAFAHMLAKFKDDHSLSAYHAEALYMADGQIVTPRVAAAIEATLALNPHDITMLEIKALGAFQSQDLRGAIGLFQRALAAGAEGERADMINRAIVRIQEDLGDAPMMAEVPIDQPPPIGSEEGRATKIQAAPKAQTAAISGRRLQVLVEVADSVQIDGATPVFVFARAISGPPMPLAVQRMTRGELPQLVTLDESMAMMQGMGLANFDTVQVVARISASGIATAGPNDYQALSGSIDLTQKSEVVQLSIEKQVKDF